MDERPVSALDVDGRDVRAVVFEDGARLDVTAVYVRPPQRLRGPLPAALGLDLTEAGLAQTDASGRTSVPTVWACGDMTTPMQAVQMVASAGFAAAAMLNHELIAAGHGYIPPQAS